MSNTNIVTVKVNELIDLLLPIYSYGAKNGMNFSKIPPVMQWGPPGVGKSDSIKTLAERLAEATGKQVKTQDVRLLLFNPVDLRGIPVPDADRMFAKWLRPQIFDLDPSQDLINILLLDEISAAPPSVQAAAYQLTLDRKVGEHKLPDNTIILAAGNRLVDKGVAFKMPTPLANRLTHFEIKPELEDWKEWAIPNGISRYIIGFLNYRPNYLYQFDSSSDDVAFATPRSWAFVNQYINMYGDVEKARTMIAGSIGLGITTEFMAYVKVESQLPNVQDILDGKDVPVPKGADVNYALSASLTTKAASATDEQLKNIARYTMKMAKEFSVLTMKDILKVKTDKGQSLKSRLLTMDEWIQWATNHRQFIS